jgi:MSHA pilin protein MshD
MNSRRDAVGSRQRAEGSTEHSVLSTQHPVGSGFWRASLRSVRPSQGLNGEYGSQYQPPAGHIHHSVFRIQYSVFVSSSSILQPSSLRARRGLSLVETVVSCALVGVLLVAAMRSVGASVFSQYRTAERGTGRLLADGLMAEILAKNYKDPGSTPQLGRESGESSTSKANYNDVDDYRDWSESPPQFADGTAMPDLADWRRTVAVDWVDPLDLSETKLWDTGAKRITVTVQHNGVVVATRIAIRTEAP